MVMHQQTMDQLAELKLAGFKQALILQAQSPGFMQMAFEERLAHLVDAEIVFRNNSRIKRYMRAAKLKYKNAFLEDIEYNASRNLDQGQIKSLAKNQWIDHDHHIIITDATGTGKTYVACALA